MRNIGCNPSLPAPSPPRGERGRLTPWRAPGLAAALMVAALGCREDAESPTAPTAPAEPGGLAFSHTAGHKVVNSLADPGNGPCTPAQCTLREAINDPQSTRISFAPGLTGPITLARPGAGGGTLTIDKRLSITGPSQRIVIRGRSPDLAFPVFRIGRSGTVTLTDLTIQEGGGGIINRGTLTLSNSVVAEHSGSGISSQHATLAVTNCLVLLNSGPGVRVVAGRATLTNSRIARNAGSGISVFNASVTLTRSTVARNSAVDGGGIASVAGRVTIDHSTITNNSATGQGGGIFNTVSDPFRRQRGSVALTNSTVSGNSAGFGAGISNAPQRSAADITLTNSTVANNSATQEGGGIFQRGREPDEDFAVLRLTNSLVAPNSAPIGPDVLNSDAEAGFVFARFNLIGDGTGSGITNTDGNQVGNVPPNTSPINPRLGPLADNGGPTRTHSLLVGSPAIDAASTPDCPATDQRGVPRPQGAACDIGSYERR